MFVGLTVNTCKPEALFPSCDRNSCAGDFGRDRVRTINLRGECPIPSTLTSAPVGIVLAQIGTPAAPDAASVRAYLRRFLSDRRIIDYSPLLWQPLLRGIILRTRPRRSARLYRSIWTEAGSPLLIHSEAQRSGLQQRLGPGYRVVLGLAYSSPGMEEAMAKLEEAGVRRILVMPLFPQYSSTTTASVYDAACFAALGRSGRRSPAAKRFIPALRLAEAYPSDPGYLAAMEASLKRTIASLKEEPDFYLLTFHGIPKRYAESGDPYPGQCELTSRLLAGRMGWEPGRWQLSYQSRFGPEAWLGPSTAETLAGLPKRGFRRPLVFSPGLVTDCLETLHELAAEGAEQFASGGGDPQALTVAPCLNDCPEWLDSLADRIRSETLGWIEDRVPCEGVAGGAGLEDAGSGRDRQKLEAGSPGEAAGRPRESGGGG